MTVTPLAIAGYPKFLYEKDVDGKYASNKYTLEVRIPKETEGTAAFVKDLLKQHADAGDNQYPPVQDGDKSEAKSDKRREWAAGHWTMKFKTTRPPTIVDSKKQPLGKDKIDGGDVVKIAFNAKPYPLNGGGLAMYLNAVQLIEKRGGGGVDEFSEEDGFAASSAAGDAFGETEDDGDF
tara:strand:- start:2255 stop:2791 length:537 start_codon:yes stop_codon:yes gene_type:complete